jgi:prefoldin subunit 5
MKTVSEAHETLDLFLGQYGVPETLVSDGSRAYTGGEFKKKEKQA